MTARDANFLAVIFSTHLLYKYHGDKLHCVKVSFFTSDSAAMSAGEHVSLYVKVDGIAHSGHRDPSGVYEIQVHSGRTIKESASTALQIARDSVPFLNDNPHGFTLRTFKTTGEEIIVPSTTHCNQDSSGTYLGRATSFPSSVALQ